MAQMSGILDHQILIRSSQSATARYLRTLALRYQEGDITNALLEAVRVELIPVLALPTWLSIATEPASVKFVLLQTYSRFGRRQAIRYVGKWLKCTTRWEKLWVELGGAVGCMNILTKLSLHEVKQLLRSIGCSYRLRLAEKQNVVTELFAALCSSTSVNEVLRYNQGSNTEDRALLHLYLELLPACTEQCVETMVEERSSLVKQWKNAKDLLTSHTRLMQQFYRKGFAMKLPFLHQLCQHTPTHQGTLPGFSESMSFKWWLVQDLVNEPTKPGQLATPESDLVLGMLKTALEKKVQSEWINEIFEVSLRFYEKFPRFKQNLESALNPLLIYILKHWDQTRRLQPEEHDLPAIEARLEKLLNLTKPEHPPETISYVGLLKEVKQDSRYDLLRKIVLHYHDRDIESDQVLQFYKFDYSLFKAIQPEPAIALLHKLTKIRPMCDYLTTPYLINQISHIDTTAISTHVQVLLEELKNNPEGASAIVAERIKVQKQLVNTTADQGQRANVACTAIWYATESGSLHLLDDVARWLKRFSRDPLTFRELMSTRCILSSANTVILAALSHHANTPYSELGADKLRTDVMFANNIVREIFQAVLGTRREPTFDPTHWRLATELMVHIIRQRLLLVADFEDKWANQGVDFDKIVWKDTLDLYTQTLETSFELETENTIPELYPSETSANPSLRLSKSAMQFIDNAARACDDLWESYRTSQNSTVVILPEIFPKGLPIQRLLNGGSYDAGWSSDQTPFIMHRAQSIALMEWKDATTPLPSEEMQKAISNFVNDLRCAIMIYVLGKTEPNLQTERLRYVWEHWMSILCQHASMDRMDAATWFRSELHDAGPQQKPLDPALKQVLDGFHPRAPRFDSYPKLLEGLNSSKTVEWNPADDKPPTSNKKYAPTAIDCTSRYREWSPPGPGFFVPEAKRTSLFSPDFWYLDRFKTSIRQLPGDVVEGLIITSLLSLDARVSENGRLLEMPFPGVDEVRYPSMYLDSDFIENNPWNYQGPLTVLERVKSRIPPRLLANLVMKYFQTLEQLPQDVKNYADVERHFFQLLKLLARSDRPQLAQDMIVMIILDRPVSSSWHRQLLSSRYLSQLESETARAIIQQFADKIMATDREDGKPSMLPGIKLSTIKQLGELLRDAAYVPDSLSMEILTRIFHHVVLVDVRLAMLESILQLLARAQGRDEKLAWQILEFLRSTVPAITGLNEYSLMSEKDWTKAEESLTVPLHSSSDSSDAKPICTKVILQVDLPAEQEQWYATNVVIPAMHLSRENKRRWMKIVLRKYNGDPAIADLATPFYMNLMGRVLTRYQQYLSIKDAQNWHDLVKANLEPSESFESFNVYLQSTPELLNSQDSRYWRREVHPGEAVLRSTGNLFLYAQALSQTWRETKRTDNTGISVNLMQKFWLEVATILLDQCTDPKMPVFGALLTKMAPTASSHDLHSDNPTLVSNAQAWICNVRPMLQELALLVNQKRTPEWQRDPHRKPAFLPSSLRMARCVLPFPFLEAAGTEHERCLRFARALYKAVKDADPGLLLPQFTTLGYLRWVVERCGSESTALVTCCLGDVDVLTGGRLDLPALYCLTLSDELMSHWGGPKKGPLWEKAEHVVRSWSCSPHETVRILGHRALARFETGKQLR